MEPETLRRVARHEARLMHFDPESRAEVLERSGTTEATHAGEHLDVIDALAREAASGAGVCAELFASAFVEERRRLGEERPALSELGPRPATPEAACVADARVAAPAPPVLAASDGVALAPVAPALVAMPVTTLLSPDALPSYLKAPAEAVTTTPPSVEKLAIAAVAPGASRPSLDVEATLPPGSSHQPTLPFAGGRDGEMGAAIRALRDEARARREGGEAHATTDETALVAADALGRASTPFEAHVEGSLPMELARYVAFLAALAQAPERAAELRAAWGLADEAHQRAVGAAFAAAFERDVGLRNRFDVLLAQARARGAPR